MNRLGVAVKAKAAAVLMTGLLLAGCGGAEEKTGLTEVRFNMAWLPQGSMAGIFVAEAKGFYAEEGLTVEAVRGFGGIRTVNELDQGMFEFGYGDPMAVALNRANGGQTRMVGAINGRWPAGACFVTERHSVATPADMKGLVFGGGQASPVQALLPAWLSRNGMEAGDVTIMQLDPAVVVASLIEGKIDLGECWLGNSIALFQKRAMEAGLSIGWLPYADFGLDIYGSGIVTSDRLIAEKPEMVRGFLRATYRGYAYAFNHPDEAVTIMKEAHSLLDAAVTRQQIVETGELFATEGGPGHIEAARIQGTLDILTEAGSLSAPIAAGDIYSTAFLPTDSTE
ncbi:ABC transporter substrate-binding protein [Pseudokordiimonas caeni]|uniref:ABC transporter substrate-binding protein n=1 Tax=Pseudokordiimonas caeni TaxID=2997908 RepID=UPI002810B0A1|nr:ABC transporter substrate-binding protein [Pseudokordiimonas caeni]